MTTYIFRFAGTGYYGFASANGLKELYWTIDEFGDPMSAEYAQEKSSGYGVCFKVAPDMDSDWPLLNDMETSDRFWMMFADAIQDVCEWKKFKKAY